MNAPSLERLILQLGVSINTRALYPPQHPRVVEAVERVREAVTALCRGTQQEAVSFLLVDDELVVDGRPLRKGSIYQEHFVATLRRLGIEGFTVARGLTAEEYQDFIAAASAGRVPVSSDHIMVGRVRLAASKENGERAGGDHATGAGDQISTEQLELARDSFVRLRSEPQAALGPMDKIVWGLMDALGRSTRQILSLAPLKAHDEYTFIHSVNVSLLVMAQARSFGIQGPMLHALGFAALVHDIGKLHIPLLVLNKPGRLEGEEWEVMKSHPERGAWSLAALESASPLAVVVAYEHHLRFDGQGGYPVLRRKRRPTLASQMTSLADIYDAVSTTRPYHKGQPRRIALEILRDRAGTHLDPFLVGNFHRILGIEPPAT